MYLNPLILDDRSDDITSSIHDSAATNLVSSCNCQPADSDNDSAFKTPTAKLGPTKKAIQGKYIQLIPGVVCSLTSHNLCL